MSRLLTTVHLVWKFTSTITKISEHNKPEKIQNISTVNPKSNKLSPLDRLRVASALSY